MLIFLFQSKSNQHVLHPDEEKVIRIKGNTQSLDAPTEIQVWSSTNDGKVKLSPGDNWYNEQTDTHYNIVDAQIEKWDYDSNVGKSSIRVLLNPSDGVRVDREGIIIDPP